MSHSVAGLKAFALCRLRPQRREKKKGALKNEVVEEESNSLLPDPHNCGFEVIVTNSNKKWVSITPMSFQKKQTVGG